MLIMAERVNHPPHYNAGGIECIDALEAATSGLQGIEAFCTANAIKYLWRWKLKNGEEDLQKAVWYINRLIQRAGADSAAGKELFNMKENKHGFEPKQEFTMGGIAWTVIQTGADWVKCIASDCVEERAFDEGNKNDFAASSLRAYLNGEFLRRLIKAGAPEEMFEYSPAAVVGEIKRLGLTFKTEISEKTIYNYIDKGIFYGISRESLPEHGERKRKYDKVERKKAARAPQGESIEERPQEINDRQTFGHWEGDCVCGKKRTKETLFVLSERLTRNEIIIKMPDQTAASVVAALNKLECRFGKKFSQIFKSITFDNGSEFMDCAGIEKSVYGKDRKRTKVYYCHPYSAYERGTNENINKMIRRFLPKGTDFRKVTAAYIQRVETWINNYPREILGFETSGSLFERYVAEAA